MPRIQPSGRALETLALSRKQPFLCRSCRAHLIRQLHSTRPVLAEEPFTERIKRTLFGSKESKEKEAKRAEAQSKAIAEAAAKERTTMEMKMHNGVEYQIAPIVDPKAKYPGYIPATTWQDLEHIGGTEYVRKVQDRGEVYQGFMPSRRAKMDETQLARLMHHIVVEILTLHRAGRDLNQACLPRGEGPENKQHTMGATIVLGGDGASSLEFNSKAVKESILKAIPELEPSEQEQTNTSRSIARSLVNELSQYSNGHPWMDMKLRDMNVKLAIVKRLLQLTGVRPSDFLLSSATTLQDLYDAFRAKEKPKKLALSEEMQSMHAEVPNVTVHQKKRTMITKEKAVGRWKVIEQELLSRNLPVTGSKWIQAKPTVAAEWVR